MLKNKFSLQIDFELIPEVLNDPDLSLFHGQKIC